MDELTGVVYEIGMRVFYRISDYRRWPFVWRYVNKVIVKNRMAVIGISPK